ncbi:hypothetical protein D3C83_147100 [compost metagenome]
MLGDGFQTDFHDDRRLTLIKTILGALKFAAELVELGLDGAKRELQSCCPVHHSTNAANANTIRIAMAER